MVKKLLSCCTLACLPACLLADFSYEQTTKMTGGMMMGMMKFAGAFSKQVREPIQSTVSVKGNRMVNWRKDHAQIIDLDSETFTEVNFPKKQYSVMTFAEMTQAMEQAMQRGRDKKAESKPGDTATDLKVDLKETGQTKQIAGYDAKEMIMTMQMDATDQKTGKKGGMVITNDMWIAPKMAGYEEIREFHKKMAAKMAWTPGGASMAAGNADIARGMAGVMKEVSKLDGITLLQVMKMTPTSEGQPVSGASGSEGQATAAQQSKPKPETPSLSGALAGRLGGFGGFGRKKKAEAPKEEKQESAEPTAAPASDASGVLVEMTTEMSGFSTAAVDPSKFAVPPGFKKVESELPRQR
jgi:hypothetical protein